ncbi:MAG: CpXC domain-containing protein [Azospirillaceae bacterium]|nr:CpXC domain-containing protein [Azospirillaceae bacterium]
MSLFNSANTPCPVCGTVKTFDLVASVNADRRPDLREAILAGLFQKQACDHCGCLFRPPPRLVYLDVGRGRWIMVGSSEDADDWTGFEALARSAFDKAFGRLAPYAAQSIGAALRARATFGWGGLLEKLLCDEHGLDDVEIELLKLAVLRSVSNPPLDEDMELRVVEVADDQLVLAWIDPADERSIGVLRVPRTTYDELVAEHDLWQPLRDDLATVLYVDFNRFLV